MNSERTETVIQDMYTRYRAELCHYVVNSAGLSMCEAEDVVQNVFVKVSEIDWHAVQNPRAFLYKTSYNLAIDLKRHSKVRSKHLECVTEANDDVFDERGPARATEGMQLLSIVAKVMWGMPSKRRKLLMMSRFDGLSYAEIARRVNLSETVVRKHINKALADCQKALQAQR